MSRRIDRITDEAALWYVKAQDPGFSASDREELASWLAASAEHVKEYLSVAAVTQDVRELAGAFDVDALLRLAQASADEANVVSLPDVGVRLDSVQLDAVQVDSLPDAEVQRRARPAVPESTQPSEARRWRPVVWSMAVTLTVVAVVGLVYLKLPRADLYTTSVGEQVSFLLDDGSVVTLNAQSRLRVVYTDTSRDIHLTAGEAMFDVVGDPDRPFRVITERAVIRAIGTQFNVRHRGSDTTVTVVEGIVDVQLVPNPRSPPGEVGEAPDESAAAFSSVVSQPTRLEVGQQARVSSRAVAVVDTNIQKAMSWRERRLTFDAWTLADVVEEFNLYNDQHIVVIDADLAARSISGAFSADDRGSFALFLSEAGIASFESRADGTIMLYPPHPD